ncbi:MAG: cation-translocating P-type ATPase [Fidelibacterota bacterium]
MEHNIYYTKTADQALEELDSKRDGLSAEEHENRLNKYGLNKLKETKKKGFLQILWAQINNPVVYLLTAAAIVAFFFGDLAEGVAILVVILINTGIGFWMEYQAQKSMEALKKMDKIKAKVVRNGETNTIDAEKLVPGDIIHLEAGMIVPADARLIETSELEADESALTGESVPVEKTTEKIAGEQSLGDRTNMLFKGTVITGGNGTAVVTATGMKTEMGNISTMVSEAEQEQIPLDKKLNKLTKNLIWLTLGLALAYFALGLLTGKEVYILFQTAVAWAIAAIPEGLPVVASIALARGMLKLAKHQAIIKQLSAVETLGETTVIFTDKTGTLTENKLSLEQITLPKETHTVTIQKNSVQIEPEIPRETPENFQHFMRISALCNYADLEKEEGDPLDLSLLRFLKLYDHEKWDAFKQMQRKVEDPFDSESKLMGSVNEYENKYYVSCKGAAESIISRSTSIRVNGEKERFSDKMKENWMKKNDEMSSKGLRVIACAYKTIDELKDNVDDATETYMHSLVFIGLAGFLDPPKPEVQNAVEECQSAGIKVIMVTGDHPGTSKNIARQVHIVEDEAANVILGDDLKKDQHSKITSTRIFSRVDPEQKLNIIDHFQQQNEIVGMTGDGVNDAPALKKADIGIAMGKRGTQVAGEVADMVLKDDSFPSIVHAVEEGRIIFQNIRKFIIYQLSYHLGEILVIGSISFTLFKLPVLPLQLLFLNLLSDVFPALALGVGKGNPAVMKLPPKDPAEPIITHRCWIRIVYYGIVFGITVTGAYLFAKFGLNLSDEIANNVAFFTLAFSQLLHVFNMRDPDEGIFLNQVTKNKFVWYALAFCIAAIVAAYFIPVLKEVLSFPDMGTKPWLLVLVASLSPVIIIQTGKIIAKKLNVMTNTT